MAKYITFVNEKGEEITGGDDRCDLDPSKICDNCFKCLEMDQADYGEIIISNVVTDEEEGDTDE